MLLLVLFNVFTEFAGLRVLLLLTCPLEVMLWPQRRLTSSAQQLGRRGRFLQHLQASSILMLLCFDCTLIRQRCPSTSAFAAAIKLVRAAIPGSVKYLRRKGSTDCSKRALS